VQVLGHRLDPALRHTVNELLWFIWGLFAVEFGIRVFPARRHMRNVVRHSADVAMIALSMLRPLRILRVLILVRMLNGAWPIRCAAAWSSTARSPRRCSSSARRWPCCRPSVHIAARTSRRSGRPSAGRW
jgi:hypothetical protein